MARSQSFRSILILLAVSLFIVACGGGGGGGSSDLTPNSFSFSAEDTVERGATIESDPITVSGIDKAVTISVTGGEYSINDGAYTSTAGTVSQGQAVKVRLTASSEFATAATATVTAGGVSGTFSVTTLEQDITPEVFTFASIINAGRNIETSSASATISDINDDATVTVSNGVYSVDSGAFTSAAGTVSNDQTITLQLTSSLNFSTEQVATLTVGGVDSTFSVTTLAQDTTPSAFSFAALTTLAFGAQAESATATVAGINDSAAVSIDVGEYSINGGAFTSDAGTVDNGQSIAVRVTAASSFGTTVRATLTIGDVAGTFDATTLAQDTTPEVFTFEALTNVGVSATAESATATVAGINDSAAVSINVGEYSINGGAFTSDAGTIDNGQTIAVRVTASSSFASTVRATLTIGGVNGTFDATTVAQDVIPDAFTFADVIDIEFSTLTPSNSITVAGINDASAISVSAGAEYRIDSGAFTAIAGTVSNGQTVQVRDTSSADVSTAVVVTLTIGGVSGTFSITTIADTTAPTAAIIFPSPVSLTEGTTLTIRGSAEDDFSDIESIVVTVRTDAGTIDTVTATSLGDGSFAQWSAQVDLGVGVVNTITVTTTDTAEEQNILAEVASVSVTHQSTPDNFPDNSDLFRDVSGGGISLDQANNRLVVADADSIYAVNLDTGVRAELIDAATMPAAPTKVHVDVDTSEIYISSADPETGRLLMLANADGSDVRVFSDRFDGVGRPYGLKKSAFDNALYVADDNGSVFTSDIISGERVRIAFRDDEHTLTEPRGLAFVSASTILIADQDEERVFSVDISLGDGDGSFTELLGPSDIGVPQDIEYDSDESRAIFVDSELDAVISVPIAGGSFTVLSDATTPNENNVLIDPSGLTLDGDNNLVYILSLDGNVNDVVLVDMVSGERVVLSRAMPPI